MINRSFDSIHEFQDTAYSTTLCCDHRNLRLIYILIKGRVIRCAKLDWHGLDTIQNSATLYCYFKIVFFCKKEAKPNKVQYDLIR